MVPPHITDTDAEYTGQADIGNQGFSLISAGEQKDPGQIDRGGKEVYQKHRQHKQIRRPAAQGLRTVSDAAHLSQLPRVSGEKDPAKTVNGDICHQYIHGTCHTSGLYDHGQTEEVGHHRAVIRKTAEGVACLENRQRGSACGIKAPQRIGKQGRGSHAHIIIGIGGRVGVKQDDQDGRRCNSQEDPETETVGFQPAAKGRKPVRPVLSSVQDARRENHSHQNGRTYAQGMQAHEAQLKKQAQRLKKRIIYEIAEQHSAAQP